MLIDHPGAAPRPTGRAGRAPPRSDSLRSSQEPSRPEDLQHELVERDAGVGAEERHRVPGAVRLELLAVALVLALVGLEQRPRDRDLAGVAGLAVDQREVAVELGLGLALVVDLEHERLEL